MLNWGKIAGSAMLLTLCWAAGSSTSWAQFTSAIEGTVTDPSGAVVPNATVTARDISTNVSRNTQTSHAGNYWIPFLPTSDFEITVAAEGFKTTVQQNIRLEAVQTRTVNVSLELGTVTTDVTITDAPLPIETSEARVSSLIGEALINNLPLRGRNFYSLVPLTAGVTGLPSGAGGG